MSMNTRADKNQENESRAFANRVSKEESGSNSGFQWMIFDAIDGVS